MALADTRGLYPSSRAKLTTGHAQKNAERLKIKLIEY